jgi:hypothetical protein
MHAQTRRSRGQLVSICYKTRSEIFLLAALDHLNVGDMNARTGFPQYVDKVSEATDDELPFRRRLLEINRIKR